MISHISLSRLAGIAVALNAQTGDALQLNRSVAIAFDTEKVY